MRQRIGIPPEKVNQLAPFVNPDNDTLVYTWQETSPGNVVSTVIDCDGDFPDSIMNALVSIGGIIFICRWDGLEPVTTGMPSEARRILLSALAEAGPE